MKLFQNALKNLKNIFLVYKKLFQAKMDSFVKNFKNFFFFFVALKRQKIAYWEKLKNHALSLSIYIYI
jgi:hypothetical protein